MEIRMRLKTRGCLSHKSLQIFFLIVPSPALQKIEDMSLKWWHRDLFVRVRDLSLGNIHHRTGQESILNPQISVEIYQSCTEFWKCNLFAHWDLRIMTGRLIISRSTVEKFMPGQPGWLSGLAPSSARGVILGTRDRVPRWAPCIEWSLLLPLPVSLPLSLSMSLMNKLNLKKIKNKKYIFFSIFYFSTGFFSPSGWGAGSKGNSSVRERQSRAPFPFS